MRRIGRWYYSYPEHTAQSVRQHEELIAALDLGDHDRAVEILEHNMELTQEALTAETAWGGPVRKDVPVSAWPSRPGGRPG